MAIVPSRLPDGSGKRLTQPFGRRTSLARSQMAALHMRRKEGIAIRRLMRDVRIFTATV